MFKRKRTPQERAVSTDRGKAKSTEAERPSPSGKVQNADQQRDRPRPVTDTTFSSGTSSSTPSPVNPQSTGHVQSGDVRVPFDLGGVTNKGGAAEEEVFDTQEDSSATKYPSTKYPDTGRERIDTAASLKIDCSYEL